MERSDRLAGIRDGKGDHASEIAQQISNNQQHQRSQSFGLIAQAQATVGEFDAALRTIKVILSPFYQADALRSLAQLQILEYSQQIKKFKSTLSKVHEFYKSADPLSFEVLNGVELLTIIAVARSTIGETEAALATFADLLEAAKTQKQRERDQDLSTIAIGYAEVGEFPTAIIGNKLSLYGSCQGGLRRCLKEKLLQTSLSIGERCNN